MITNRKPRVLMLSPDPPGPYGAAVRLYHFAQALAAEAELHLVVLDQSEFHPVPAEFRSRLASFLELPRDTTRQVRSETSLGKMLKVAAVVGLPWRKGGRDLLHAAYFHASRLNDGKIIGTGGIARSLYARCLLSEVALGTRWLGLQPSRSVERALAFERMLPLILQRYSGMRFDVLWFENSYLLREARQLQAAFPGSVLMCNANNVEYSLHERLAGIAVTGVMQRWFRTQADALRRLERQAYAQSRITFACSTEDDRLIRELAPGATTVVISNGVDVEFFQPRKRLRSEPRLLFTGTMGYEPNRDAVEYFLQDILPLIRKQVPDCRFCIAGRSARDYFGARTATVSGLEIASDVPDMRPYYEQASVVVVPLRAGSGVRTKILEAMAMGRAIVSTTVGAEGIELQPDHHACLADGAEEFAAQVVLLLLDPDRTRKMELAARELVCAKYDWKSLGNRALATFQASLEPARDQN